MAYYDQMGEVARIFILMAVVVTLIIFMSMDAVKALMKRAHWIPGDLLVLSALTIQLLSLLGGQSDFLKEAMDNPKQLEPRIIQNELWMIHARRIMLCVALAYMLPSMACRGSEYVWGKLLALVITIFVHITWDLYIVHRLAGHSQYWPHSKKTGQAVFIASACIVSLALIGLILLLGCAYIASRGVEVFIAQKIPLLLSSTHDSGAEKEEEEDWQTVEDEVLRSYIVVRAYSLEYIIARSPLTTSAAAIVTLQILISIGGRAILSRREPHDVVFILTVLERGFALLGWAIIGWRWATAVAYYQRWKSVDLCSAFRVEDVWTGHIKEMMEAGKTQLRPKKRLQDKVKKVMANEPINIKMPRRLLYVLLGLQWLVVLSSKVCWVVSLMMFHNRCMSKLISFLLKKHEKKVFEDYKEYEEILKGLGMLGETPESLWVANRKSIAEARNLVVQGHWDGEYKCRDLIEFLARKRTPGDGSEKEMKYLYRSQVEPLEVERHFLEASKRSRKMEAVTLIKIFFSLSPFNMEDKDGTSSLSDASSTVEDISNAYSQAWEIIDFIEETDLEAEGILSEAADNLFSILQTKIEKKNLPATACGSHTHGQECIAAALDKLEEENKRKTEPRGIHICRGELKPQKDMSDGDFMDWREAVVGNALYKLCRGIDRSSIGSRTGIKELLDEIESRVADIIYDCMKNVKDTSVVNSRKWARDSQENKIGRALYTVGKARVVTRELKRRERHLFNANPQAVVIAY